MYDDLRVDTISLKYLIIILKAKFSIIEKIMKTDDDALSIQIF